MDIYERAAQLNRYTGHWHELFALTNSVTVSKANPSGKRCPWDDRKEIMDAARSLGFKVIADNARIISFLRVASAPAS